MWDTMPAYTFANITPRLNILWFWDERTAPAQNVFLCCIAALAMLSTWWVTKDLRPM
jgi:hypothetical protein